MTQHSKCLNLCLWLAPLTLLGQIPSTSQRVGDVNNKGQFIVGSNNKIVYVSVPQSPLRRELKSLGLVAPIKLHHQFELESAVYDFDRGDKLSFGKSDKYRLLDSKQLEARTLIFSALKRYAQSLADLQKGTGTFHEDDLQAGLELQSLSGSETRSLIGEFPGSAEATNAITASLFTLGQYLVAKRRTADEPRLVRTMDPTIQQLCSFMIADISILRAQSRKDFLRMAEEQMFFLRAAANLSAFERREETRKLPEIYETSDAIDESLNNLVVTIRRYASLHQYLASQSHRSSPNLGNQLNSLLLTSDNL